MERVFAASPIAGTLCPYEDAVKSVDDLLLQSIDEVLLELLGRRARDAVYDHLERNQSLARSEIPKHLNKFVQLLDETFGKGSKTICKSIIRRMYNKLEWKFSETQDYEFMDYLDAIRVRIAKILIERAGEPQQDATVLGFPETGTQH